MGDKLAKTRTVLTVLSISSKTRMIPSNTIPFDAGEDEESRSHVVFVDKSVWEEMHKPDTITVTIEPGDRING